MRFVDARREDAAELQAADFAEVVDTRGLRSVDVSLRDVVLGKAGSTLRRPDWEVDSGVLVVDEMLEP